MDTGMAPTAGNVIARVSNLVFDASIVRSPYILATSAPGGAIIPPGQQNVPQLLSDFSNSLEWPFEVTKIRFVNDPQHTYRDWRVRVVDQTYAQEWMKYPVLVESLINVDTGFWELPMPWTIRPQGGGQNWFVDNLDPVNPIQIVIALFGSLQFPARGQ